MENRMLVEVMKSSEITSFVMLLSDNGMTKEDVDFLSIHPSVVGEFVDRIRQLRDGAEVFIEAK